ncbi:hypothetical protein HMI55_005077 [Coelomomyces lativittatus]|nr:hypothetical protein HMI55_005077 [Coelomomyces lativittatus]
MHKTRLKKTRMSTQMDDQFFKSFQPKDAEGSKYEQVPEKQRLDLNVRLICHNCRDPIPNIIEDFKQGRLVHHKK